MLAALLGATWPTNPVAAQAVRTIYTIPNTVLCVSRFQIKEGKTAVAAHDEKWLRELGCIEAPAGLPVIVIDVNRPLKFFQVRVQPIPSGPAMTMFGSLFDFTEPAAPPNTPPK